MRIKKPHWIFWWRWATIKLWLFVCRTRSESVCVNSCNSHLDGRTYDALETSSDFIPKQITFPEQALHTKLLQKIFGLSHLARFYTSFVVLQFSFENSQFTYLFGRITQSLLILPRASVPDEAIESDALFESFFLLFRVNFFTLSIVDIWYAYLLSPHSIKLSTLFSKIFVGFKTQLNGNF